jgi:hypothetical protein
LNCIVHINGWPGSGKLTIARQLTKLLNGRLVDNHTLINPADCLFDRADPHYWPLRCALRSVVFEYAVKVSFGTPIVCTNALADIPSDRAHFDAYRELARKREAQLVPVMLSCELEENIRRLTETGRSHLLKLTNADVLRDVRGNYQLYRPGDLMCIDLDVSELSAQASAAALNKLIALHRSEVPGQ